MAESDNMPANWFSELIKHMLILSVAALSFLQKKLFKKCLPSEICTDTVKSYTVVMDVNVMAIF